MLLPFAIALTTMSVAPAAAPAATDGRDSQFVWRRGRGFHLLTAPEQRAALDLSPRYGSWEPLYVLGQGRFGTWSLLGSVAGLGPSCTGEMRSRCSPIAEAGIALSWRPRGSFVSFFAGLVFTSPVVGSLVGASPKSKASPMLVGGIVMQLPSMLDVVKFARGLPTTWTPIASQ